MHLLPINTEIMSVNRLQGKYILQHTPNDDYLFIDVKHVLF